MEAKLPILVRKFLGDLTAHYVAVEETQTKFNMVEKVRKDQVVVLP